eukprot:2748820-Alexandrium_andersonii.AAC.1
MLPEGLREEPGIHGDRACACGCRLSPDAALRSRRGRALVTCTGYHHGNPDVRFLLATSHAAK